LLFVDGQTIRETLQLDAALLDFERDELADCLVEGDRCFGDTGLGHLNSSRKRTEFAISWAVTEFRNFSIRRNNSPRGNWAEMIKP